MSITNQIHFRNLRGDLYGGLTATVIALPMALAFGVASGAGAQAGLYGAILVGFFAALFGGTPTLISEPTGPMTVVATATIANAVAADPENGLAIAFTVVMMAGLLQIAFGLLRLGKYVTLMPYTVISGFMSGIGVVLIVLQLAPFLGQEAPGGGVVGTLRAVPELVQQTVPVELGLGLLTVAILFLSPKAFNKIVPPQLSALVAGTLVSLALGGDEIRRIGEISAGLPTLQVPDFRPGLFSAMLTNALVLAMLGCIDALLTSAIADSLTRANHDSNKELIGQGIGNLASGLFGGLPGAGATMGTVVNIQAGGRTALSGLVRAGLLLAIVLGAGGLTATIPLAVLAGIALKVGFDIIDWRFLKRAHAISHKAAAIMYGVIALTVFVDLIAAVGIGVFVANILTIERLSELRSRDVQSITDADDAIALDPAEKDLLRQADGRVLLFQLSGPMIFGVAKAIAREQEAMSRCDAVVIDLSDVPHLGVTSSLAIENAIARALDERRQVFVVGATGQTKRRLATLETLDRLPPERWKNDRETALRAALASVKTSPSEAIASS